MMPTKKLMALKAGAQILRTSDSERKNRVLLKAEELLGKRQAEILKANHLDLKRLSKDTPLAFKDRLLLNAERIEGMRESLRQVARLEDPVGKEADVRVLKNGLKIKRVRSPIGVILMIFESRPNVAVEAFSLAFKAGNVIILRGGKESMKTTAVLYKILQDALGTEGLGNCLWGITDPDRKIPQALLKQSKWIDLVVPRGGEGLISYVVKNSKIPIIKNDRGLCHVYVHEDADLAMAVRIAVNSKTQRPGVCNAMETLLVHRNVASKFLPDTYDAMASFDVRWFACPESHKILKGRKGVFPATPKSWDTEYLDYKINCRVIRSLDEALDHIENHGSRHSESVVTKSEQVARLFQSRVDSAAVYWNASTRFTDGFEFGLGGELGISTQKLHVRGPVGLNELTTFRWVIDGDGQTRQ